MWKCLFVFFCTFSFLLSCEDDGFDLDDLEITSAQCDDGVDNDNDGAVDCDDEDCKGFTFCEFEQPASGPCDDDEIPQPYTELCWSRCLYGESWDGDTCSGSPLIVDSLEAATTCAGERRLPTLAETAELLGNCDGIAGVPTVCDACAASHTCSKMFGSDARTYHLMQEQGLYWDVSYDNGVFQFTPTDNPFLASSRCVRER